MNWLKDAVSSDVDGFLPTSPRKKLKAIVKGTLNNTKLTVGCLRSVCGVSLLAVKAMLHGTIRNDDF